MPVHRDASGNRWVQAEVEVPGTPEEVWEAIATGPGITSWFVPSQVDGRVGGHPGRAPLASTPKSELPPAHPGEPPPRAPYQPTQVGRHHGAPGGSHRVVVRCVARRDGPRVVREVASLVRRSEEADKRLATLSIDTEIRFRSPAERAAFTHELTQAVTALAARYHDESAPGGRPHRLVVVAHPLPHEPQPQE